MTPILIPYSYPLFLGALFRDHAFFSHYAVYPLIPSQYEAMLIVIAP